MNEADIKYANMSVEEKVGAVMYEVGLMTDNMKLVLHQARQIVACIEQLQPDAEKRARMCSYKKAKYVVEVFERLDGPSCSFCGTEKKALVSRPPQGGIIQ